MASSEPQAPRDPEPEEQRDDLNARLDKLQDAANAASGHARNVYVTFLLFGLYLAIIFGSTTHEHLLRESPVTLPLLGVGLPLFGFYWIAPALFVLLHLNLLLEFYLLSGKLHRLDRALEEAVAQKHLSEQRAGDRRAQLYPFPFSHMLVGQHGRLMWFLLWLVVWLTVLVLPVVLLLMGQVRFLPYHDAWTTMWLRFMVAADLSLILIFWRAIRHPAHRLLRHPGRWLWHQSKVALPALVVLVLSFVIFTFPGDYGAGDSRFGDPMEEALLDEDGWLAGAYPERWRVLRAPDSWKPAEPLIFWPTQVLFDFFPFLQRNMVARNINLVGSWPTRDQIEQFGEDLAWRTFGAPPILQGRDLRYADLSGSIFVRGILREANLQGAHTDETDFKGADLRHANLQRVDFSDTNLEGADLSDANLQGAGLFGDNLQSAVLFDANLQGVVLCYADLRGADLTQANLQGADLSHANLQGAVLRSAYLQGANLHYAGLQGTDFRGAHLWRVLQDDLSSRWTLADLREVDVEPIEGRAAWIELMTALIDETTHCGQFDVEHLAALEDGEPSKLPRFPKAWRTAPNVMFEPQDPLPQVLGWGARVWATDDAYDEDLAWFLGELACRGGEAAPSIRGLATRALDDWDRLYAQRFAARLTGDDCPLATELPNDVRSSLEQLAARPEQ